MKINLLALDTSSTVSSVALIKESQYHFYSSGSGERQHTQQILLQIQTVLSEANLSLSQLHALAFTPGPGSFTGIRLAATLAQGLAFGANLPIIAISTLQTIAQQTYTNQGATQVAVAINAFAEKIYWGIYQCIAGEMQPLAPDILCSPQEATLLLHAAQWTGAGNAWDVYAKQLQHLPMQSVHTDIHADAKSVACLAIKPCLAGEFLAPTEALPVYLYGADCWKKTSS
jgi:tRNA threonylcarbamoyladenosine biosynthesis protein TsaB